MDAEEVRMAALEPPSSKKCLMSPPEPGLTADASVAAPGREMADPVFTGVLSSPVAKIESVMFICYSL